MREILTDLLKHTISIGVLEQLKVTGSSEETLIESMAGDKTVVLKACLKEPLPEFNGEFGIGNLGILKGLLDFVPFKTENSIITVQKEQRKNGEVPVEIVFIDEEKRPAHFRLLAETENQPKQIKLNWDIEFEPTESKIKELIKLASIFSSTEDYFYIKTEDDELRFYIGNEQSSNHHSYVVFSKNIEGTCNGFYWHISQILGILKLIDGNTISTNIQVSNKGVIKITLETKNAFYYYILPASTKV